MQLAVLVLSLSVAYAPAGTVWHTGDARVGGTVSVVPSGAAPAAGRFSDSLAPMPGWPQHVGVGALYKPVGVTLADINGDDTLEIIAGSTDNTVHVWNYHGTELAGWPRTVPGAVQSKIAVGDLTGDGRMELVVATRNGMVCVYEPDGTPATGWPQNASGDLGLVSPTLADIDGNESLEVIMPQMVSGPGHVSVWKADGTVYPGWPQNTDYLAVATASVADVDGDGAAEICAPSYNSLYLWDKDGNLKPGWPVVLGSGASYSQPELYDLDHDGKLEIGFSSYPSGTGEVLVFRYDGSNQPGWPRTMPAAQPYVCPVAGAVLADTALSIFCGGHMFGGNGFNGWTAGGSVMAGWPVAPDFLECSPVVFDIEGSGSPGVMVAGNTTPGSLYAYHADGSPVTAFPYPTPDAALVNSPAVADVDLDGRAELALMTQDGSVSLWKVHQDEYHPWLTDWGTWFHDNWHTGWLHPHAPTGLSAARGHPGVALTWRRNTEPDIAGYNVYRTLTSDSGYRRLNPRPVADTAWTDTAAAGDTTFYYAVDAVIRAGGEGRLSAEAAFNPSGVGEGRSKPYASRVTLPTVVHGILNLQSAIYNLQSAIVLLDVSGRRVLTLHPGVNDVSRLAPGVYFVSAARTQVQVARKVVITR